MAGGQVGFISFLRALTSAGLFVMSLEVSVMVAVGFIRNSSLLF